VLFDRFSYLNWIPVPKTLDNLIHVEKTPAMIAILIDNLPDSRISELEYNSAFMECFQQRITAVDP
jgi:enterochelin esterase-like enzyme